MRLACDIRVSGRIEECEEETEDLGWTELRHSVGKCSESVQIHCDSAEVGCDKSLYLTEMVKQSGIDQLVHRS